MHTRHEFGISRERTLFGLRPLSRIDAIGDASAQRCRNHRPEEPEQDEGKLARPRVPAYLLWLCPGPAQGQLSYASADSPFREFVGPPELLGPDFAVDSWTPWKTIIAGALDEKFSHSERQHFCELPGCDPPPVNCGWP